MISLGTLKSRHLIIVRILYRKCLSGKPLLEWFKLSHDFIVQYCSIDLFVVQDYSYAVAWLIYEMTMRLGAASGADLGKVTDKTPFSNVAFTSSS